LSSTFQQAAIHVADPQTFSRVRSAVAASFSNGRVAGFLKSLDRAALRIRDFESILARGLLGSGTVDDYSQLVNGDRGQIREFYLASLEQVAPDLRNRFFKLYAYY
jgi:hypothetical protein